MKKSEEKSWVRTICPFVFVAFSSLFCFLCQPCQPVYIYFNNFYLFIVFLRISLFTMSTFHLTGQLFPFLYNYWCPQIAESKNRNQMKNKKWMETWTMNESYHNNMFKRAQNIQMNGSSSPKRLHPNTIKVIKFSSFKSRSILWRNLSIPSHLLIR